MDTHLSRGKDRRAKGRTKWPEIYLTIEIILLFTIEFIVYLIGIKILVILVAIGLIFFFFISSIPRYKRVVARQENHKVINNAHRVRK